MLIMLYFNYITIINDQFVIISTVKHENVIWYKLIQTELGMFTPIFIIRFYFNNIEYYINVDNVIFQLHYNYKLSICYSNNC